MHEGRRFQRPLVGLTALLAACQPALDKAVPSAPPDTPPVEPAAPATATPTQTPTPAPTAIPTTRPTSTATATPLPTETQTPAPPATPTITPAPVPIPQIAAAILFPASEGFKYQEGFQIEPVVTSFGVQDMHVRYQLSGLAAGQADETRVEWLVRDELLRDENGNPVTGMVLSARHLEVGDWLRARLTPFTGGTAGQSIETNTVVVEPAPPGNSGGDKDGGPGGGPGGGGDVDG